MIIWKVQSCKLNVTPLQRQINEFKKHSHGHYGELICMFSCKFMSTGILKISSTTEKNAFSISSEWNGKREEEKCWRRYVALRSHARTLRPHINAMQWVKIIECISHKSLKNNTIAARERGEEMGEGKLCILISILFNFTQFNLISAYIENWRVKAQKTTPRCNAFYSQINKKKEIFTN